MVIQITDMIDFHMLKTYQFLWVLSNFCFMRLSTHDSHNSKGLFTCAAIFLSIDFKILKINAKFEKEFSTKYPWGHYFYMS